MPPGSFAENPAPRLVFDPSPPHDFFTEIPTQTKDCGRGKIRSAGPILKFAAAQGDSGHNVNLQAGHALVRIDFGVSMVTRKAIPAPCRNYRLHSIEKGTGHVDVRALAVV